MSPFPPMTDEQYWAQPKLGREIIDLDRRLEAEDGRVVPLARGELLRRRRLLPTGWFSATYAAPDGGRPGGTPVALIA